MDSFELNKIIAAILMVVLLVIGIGKISNVIFHVEKPKIPGYAVVVEKAVSTSSVSGEVVKVEVDIAALMAMGDITSGEKIFKKCAACHSIVKGGKNKIGPALYGIVGKQSAVAEGYSYSKALKAHGKNWSFEELNAYLLKPQSHIKGTKMAFAGLRKDKDRASIILYLNSQSDSPLPKP